MMPVANVRLWQLESDQTRCAGGWLVQIVQDEQKSWFDPDAGVGTSFGGIDIEFIGWWPTMVAAQRATREYQGGCELPPTRHPTQSLPPSHRTSPRCRSWAISSLSRWTCRRRSETLLSAASSIYARANVRPT